MFDFLFYQEDIPSKGYRAGDLKPGYAIAAMFLCFLAMALSLIHISEPTRPY